MTAPALAVPYDLVAVGLTTIDIVGRPIDRLPETEATTRIEAIEILPAATAASPAMIGAMMGLRSGLAAGIGADRKGRLLRFMLEELGVDTGLLRMVEGWPTSTTILAADSAGRRRPFHAVGAASFLELDDGIRAAVLGARHLHWGAVGGQKIAGGPGAELVAAAKAAGVVVTCDLISPGPDAADEVRRLLPNVDWFMPSAVEARFLTGHEDLTDAIAALRDMGATGCVVKDGGDGALLAEPGAPPRRIPAFRVEVVDTTCCGDGFCGGFVVALSKGFEPEAATRFAAATGAFVAQGVGTLGRLDGLDDPFATLERFSREAPTV